MSADRYVVLGLARPRAEWFRTVAQWSTSAAVLVMAFLGAAMWVAFQLIFNNASDRVAENVDKIGS